MNKEEFLSKINNLRVGSFYGDKYDIQKGFDDCKNKVIELIPELDVEGLNPKAFELFRNALNDMTNLYSQLFVLQSQIFNLQQEKMKDKDLICDMQQDLDQHRKFIEEKKLLEEFQRKMSQKGVKPYDSIR